ncbi:MAG: hypothetical protein K9K39_00310 [Desulfohalobiaceae bacterium]|nr:hypothetical protein [Desulfohalobiaceae bacterium]
MTAIPENDFLLTAMQSRFSEEDAACLCSLVRTCFQMVHPRYQDIDMAVEEKDECLLTAFQKRIVLPAHSGPGGGWNDRSLSLQEEEYYTMPPVVWYLMRYAEDQGRFLPEQALEKALRSVLGEEMTETAALFREARKHAQKGQIEAGLFAALARNLGLDLDLHETLDRYVLLGIASPCSKGQVHTGLVWYEINPCLFW